MHGIREINELNKAAAATAARLNGQPLPQPVAVPQGK